MFRPRAVMVLLLQVPSHLLVPSQLLSFLFLIFSATTRVSGLRAVKPAHKYYALWLQIEKDYDNAYDTDDAIIRQATSNR